MPARPGAKQSPVGILRERPAADARLHLLIKLLSEERGTASTLATDAALIAGLTQLGFGELVRRVLNERVEDKQGLARLEAELRREMRDREQDDRVPGEASMVS